MYDLVFFFLMAVSVQRKLSFGELCRNDIVETEFLPDSEKVIGRQARRQFVGVREVRAEEVAGRVGGRL